MPPLDDPENPPVPVPVSPPCPCRCRCRCRCRSRSRSRSWSRSRCRRLLLPVLAALGAAALGAAATVAAALLGLFRGDTPQQAATAAHMLLSPGSLTVPSKPKWRYEEGINGVFLSGDVVMMTDGTLQVTAGGLYLLYGQFALTCTAPPCSPGTVTLQLRRQKPPHLLLTVPLALSDGTGSDPARSALAQAVGQLQPGDVLSLELKGKVAEEADGDGWQLAQDEREGNFVGLLRIAGG